MSIKNDHTLHPITALDLFQDQDGPLLILAGEGPYLKVFETGTSRLISQCRVFEGQTIHGIAVREAVPNGNALQVVIWGGSSLLMLTKGDLRQVLLQDLSTCPGSASVVSDWILDAKISPYDEESCVLVTAHNTVLRATLTNGSAVYLEELHSPSRSILYSAHLDWPSPNEVLVAAGTVFGEIIAWKCSIPQDATQSIGEVLFTFTGHEGSIFGVNISPLITHADQSTSRFLASCSDDRTIRVWDLSSVALAGNPNRHATSLRETGFGNDDKSNEHKCVAVAMGHASRIWRVKFLVEGTDTSELVNILSFGEDSTTQQWSLDFGLDTRKPEKSGKHVLSSPEISNSNSQVSAQLVNQKISAFHSGKHIWSAATRSADDGRTWLATGGADGKISLYPVEMYGHKRASLSAEHDAAINFNQEAGDGSFRSSWSTEEVFDLLPSIESSRLRQSVPIQEQPLPEELRDENTDLTPSKKTKPKKVRLDTFSRYAFVSEKQIVVTTTFGRVLIGNLEGDLKWEEMSLPKSGRDDLKSWSVVKSLPEAGLAFVAGTNGKIYGFHSGSTLLEIGRVESKVADMFVVTNPITNQSELLVTTLSGSCMDSFVIDRVSKNPSFTEQLSYELPPKFIVTSAGRSGDCLVLGSRYGSLAIFDSERQIIHVEDSHDALNGDAITSVISMTSDRNDRIYFLITGRKGAYLIFALSLTQNSGGIPSTRLSLVHQGSPPFGPMIEKAWFSESDIILYGFKSKNFIVWNETQQCEIMSVECGGAHRSYAYSTTKQGGHFIYTKASRLYIYSQSTPSHKIIKSGGHGREIKSCAVSDDQKLMATGAEDTAIRIWSYDDSGTSLKNQFKCLAVVQKHTAGIQHLQWHQSSYLFSSGGNEEFFIWAVESLPNSGVGIMCEAACPDQSEDSDLRIMNFDVTELPSAHGVKFLISLAYSDSTLRVYTYQKGVGYGFVARGRYTSSCLLQIRTLKIDDAGGLWVLTAATDGNLALWKASVSASDSEEQTLVMLWTRKVHQSSIKALDIATTVVKNQVLIATGGDDNALAISLFTLADLPSFASPKSFILRAAHAAAITGLTYVPNTNRNPSTELQDFRIVSSSNDQRVKEWNIRLTPGEVGGELEVVQIRKVGDAFTPVADVGDVACLRCNDGPQAEKKVLIVGNGMEVWRVCGDTVI